MTRRKFRSKFKTKFVLEALNERNTISELSQKYEISLQQINLWKGEFLASAESIFSKGLPSKKSEAQEKEDRLLKPSAH